MKNLGKLVAVLEAARAVVGDDHLEVAVLLVELGTAMACNMEASAESVHAQVDSVYADENNPGRRALRLIAAQSIRQLVQRLGPERAAETMRGWGMDVEVVHLTGKGGKA